MQPKYKRILLKLSGESLAGEAKHGIDFDTVVKICEPIKKCVDEGVQVGIVVGGGNFWRGRSSGDMDRTRADHMGMLATTINALGVADALEQLGVEVRVQTAITMRQVAEPYIRNKAVTHLEKGRVVIFGCGTGLHWSTVYTTRILISMKTQRSTIPSPSLRYSAKNWLLWTAQPPRSARTTICRFSYSASTIPITFTRQYAVKTSEHL